MKSRHEITNEACEEEGHDEQGEHLVDKVAGEIKGVCDLLNTTYDHFIRTTDDYHEKAVQKIFKKLMISVRSMM